jgi:ATP-dependent DNA ligase
MARRLPSPMLARSGAIPTGDYSFEVKWDGFRALVSRNGDVQVRSPPRLEHDRLPGGACRPSG